MKPDPELLFERFLEQSYQHGISLNSSLCRPEIIVVSDPGQDLDDEMAFVLLRALIEEGLVSCAGVVCTRAGNKNMQHDFNMQVVAWF